MFIVRFTCKKKIMVRVENNELHTVMESRLTILKLGL